MTGRSLLPPTLPGPRRGALTFRLPLVDGELLPSIRLTLATIRDAMARCYGVGRYVAPIEAIPCRFLPDDGVLEIRVTIETPDNGVALQREIARQVAVKAWLRHAVTLPSGT